MKKLPSSRMKKLDMSVDEDETDADIDGEDEADIDTGDSLDNDAE